MLRKCRHGKCCWVVMCQLVVRVTVRGFCGDAICAHSGVSRLLGVACACPGTLGSPEVPLQCHCISDSQYS